jgi:hypothetical protein
MSCREFDPTIERFCSNPADFVSSAQLLQMCAFFDIKGVELKKIKIMAARAEEDRSRARLAPHEPPPTEAGEIT